MIRYIFIIFLSLMLGGSAFAQGSKNVLMLDDFEGDIVSTPTGTIDAGAGNGSSVDVSADKVIFKTGKQSLKITYDAVSGGYISVARGFGLDVKTAAQWLVTPEKVDWAKYAAFSFYFYGSASKMNMAFDVKDANGEIFRFMVTDDTKGWKQVICPFDQFFPRGDWQPPTATVDGKLDFPVKSFQFEPIAIKKGSINIDDVGIEALN